MTLVTKSGTFKVQAIKPCHSTGTGTRGGSGTGADAGLLKILVGLNLWLVI